MGAPALVSGAPLNKDSRAHSRGKFVGDPRGILDQPFKIYFAGSPPWRTLRMSHTPGVEKTKLEVDHQGEGAPELPPPIKTANPTDAEAGRPASEVPKVGSEDAPEG
jgi:hypothetical protein